MNTRQPLLWIAICFFLGIVYTQIHSYLPKNHIHNIARYYSKKDVCLEGVVISDVEHRNTKRGEKTVFTLEVKSFQTRWGWRTKTGKVLVNVFRKESLGYGDYLYLEGKIHPPFNFSSDFSYQDFLARKGIFEIFSVKKEGRIEVVQKDKGFFLKSLSLKIRNKLVDILTQYLPDTEAGIMAAVLLGQRYNVSKDIKQVFQHTGTAHVLPTTAGKKCCSAFSAYFTC